MAASAACGAPAALGNLFVFGEGEEGMEEGVEEAMAHCLDDASLDFGVEGGEVKVGGGEEDGEGCGEVLGAVELCECRVGRRAMEPYRWEKTRVPL